MQPVSVQEVGPVVRKRVDVPEAGLRVCGVGAALILEAAQSAKDPRCIVDCAGDDPNCVTIQPASIRIAFER